MTGWRKEMHTKFWWQTSWKVATWNTKKEMEVQHQDGS